jgi:hypothetical protein
MSHTAHRSDIVTGAAQPTITVDFGVARNAGVRCYPAHIRQIGAGSLAGGGSWRWNRRSRVDSDGDQPHRLRGSRPHEPICFISALPMTSTGTIQKFTLREREWAGHTSRING